MHLWCGYRANRGKRQYIKSIRIVCRERGWILLDQHVLIHPHKEWRQIWMGEENPRPWGNSLHGLKPNMPHGKTNREWSYNICSSFYVKQKLIQINLPKRNQRLYEWGWSFTACEMHPFNAETQILMGKWGLSCDRKGDEEVIERRVEHLCDWWE